MADNSRYVRGNLFGDGKKYSPINLQQQYTKKKKSIMKIILIIINIASLI
jgi:hypothetical protein